MPRVPPGGLHENSRKQLQHKRDCTNQMLKAAMAINGTTLAEMEVPESYLEVLPKVLKCCQLYKFYDTKENIVVRFSDELDKRYLLFAIGLRMEDQAWVTLFIDTLHQQINFRRNICLLVLTCPLNIRP